MALHTHNNLVTLLQNIATAHKQLKGFGIGNKSEVEGIANKSFPYMWAVPVNAAVQLNDSGQFQTIQHTFRIEVFDLVHKDRSTETEVLSDTQQILLDIIKILHNENVDFEVIGSPVLDPFVENYGDDVSGWYSEITIEIPFDSNYCDVPSDVFFTPGISSGISTSPYTFLTCSTLGDCPLIISIENTLVSLQDQIDNIPPGGNENLAQTLTIGNTTGEQSIISDNGNSILKVLNAATELLYGFTSGVTIDNTSTTITHASLIYATAPVVVLSDDVLMRFGTSTSNTYIYGSDGLGYSEITNNTRHSDGSTYIHLGLVDSYQDPATAYVQLFSRRVDLVTPANNARVILTLDAYAGEATFQNDHALSRGLEYAADYSANYSNRSLVDKEYVDSLTPPTPTLTSVLAAGNSTGGNDIVSDDGNSIITIDDGVTRMSNTGGVMDFTCTVGANISKLDFTTGVTPGRIVMSRTNGSLQSATLWSNTSNINTYTNGTATANMTLAAIATQMDFSDGANGGYIYIIASDTTIAHDFLINLIAPAVVLDSLVGTGTEMVVADATGLLSRQAIPVTPTLTANVTATFDGQGGVISAGNYIRVYVPYNMTLSDFQISSYDALTGATVSGSITLDVKRSGTTIIGAGNKPLLSSASSNSGALSGWTSVAVTAGDALDIYVSVGAVTCTKVTVTINGTRS